MLCYYVLYYYVLEVWKWQEVVCLLFAGACSRVGPQASKPTHQFNRHSQDR
jgi:hypothetical protein